MEHQILPIAGMDLSVDESNMPNTVAAFIKGWELYVNENSGEGGKQTANQTVFTKLESNKKVDEVVLPDGYNQCIGGGYVKETGHYYSCVYNSNQQHTIWRLDAKNNIVKKVIQNPCLDFRISPENYINNSTRFTYVIYETKTKNGATRKNTWIFITDNNSRTKQIHVEDSIATNGFTHPFFNLGTECCNVCDIITLGAPAKPTSCIEITPIQRENTEEEKNRINFLKNKTWQFRLKYIDVWGRESLHGVISSMYAYYSEEKCINKDKLEPRCLQLEFDGGCKWIAKIVVEYANCNNGINTQWYEYTTIEKYNNCTPLGEIIDKFWLRPYKYGNTNIDESNFISYDQQANKFKILFCASKNSELIPEQETALVQNEIPNKSSSISRIGNKLVLANNERGYAPFPCNTLKNIKYKVESIKQTDVACDIVYRKITIWAVIYSKLSQTVTNLRYVTGANGEQQIGYGHFNLNGQYSATPHENLSYYEQI
jgi:hypothetical protein